MHMALSCVLTRVLAQQHAIDLEVKNDIAFLPPWALGRGSRCRAIVRRERSKIHGALLRPYKATLLGIIEVVMKPIL